MGAYTLSYQWGIQAPPSTISLDGNLLKVGPNLAAAIQALQLSNSSRVIWIDATCINQADLDERNHQVALMRDIYTECSRVLLWLGPFDGKFLKGICSLAEAGYQQDPVEWMKSTVGTATYCSTWESFQSLLNNRYWERIWIVQELVSAPSIEILHGWEFTSHDPSASEDYHRILVDFEETKLRVMHTYILLSYIAGASIAGTSGTLGKSSGLVPPIKGFVERNIHARAW